MEISLPPELARWVAELVAAGRFESEGAVVRAGLLLLQRKEEDERLKLEALRGDVQMGLDQAERGELLPGDAVFRRAYERIAACEEKIA